MKADPQRGSPDTIATIPAGDPDPGIVADAGMAGKPRLLSVLSIPLMHPAPGRTDLPRSAAQIVGGLEAKDLVARRYPPA